MRAWPPADVSRVEADVIIIAVSVPNIRPLVRSLQESRSRSRFLGNFKRKLASDRLPDDQGPWRSEGNYSQKVEHGSDLHFPSKDNPTIIPMQNRIYKATDLQIDYETRSEV